MPISPHLSMLFSQLILNAPQLATQAPALFKGLQQKAYTNHESSFGKELAENAITATQEAINRGYDLGLLNESAKFWGGLPMSIMEDPIAGGGEGAVVDLNNNPIYTSTGTGDVFPYMYGRGGGDAFDEDTLQKYYKYLSHKNSKPSTYKR